MINEEDLIKSKLNAYRPSFEASDWAAMEKLLDEKSDKKPIVIWWRYGLAVGLFFLLSAGLVAYFANNNQSNISQSTSNPISNNSTNTSNTNSKIKSTNSLSSNSKSNTSTNNFATVKSTNPSNQSIINKHQVKSSNPILNYHSAKENTLIQFISPANTANNFVAIANDRILQNNIENNSISSMALREKQMKIEFSQLALTEIEHTTIENTIKSTSGTFANIRKRASNIPLDYSIALQGSGLINLALQRNSVNLYLDQLSDANLIGQVMIGNHVGVYTGIGYADRKTAATHDSTIYSDIVYSNLNVLNNKNIGISIPVGITANIYKQAFINVYAKAGINNLVFLKEYTTVEYTSNPATPISNNATYQVGNTMISSSADLLTANADYNVSNANPLSVYNNEILQKTYKEKPTERYLAELNLAVGIKAKMTKNLSFVFEPAYRMGFKNKHRSEVYHSLAFSGAFVFSF